MENEDEEIITCILPYQELLEGSNPLLCNVHLGKPESGRCEDCLLYKQITDELHELEQINHLVFHALARQYNINVDLIGEIVADFTEMVSALVEGIPHISHN